MVNGQFCVIPKSSHWLIDSHNNYSKVLLRINISQRTSSAYCIQKKSNFEMSIGQNIDNIWRTYPIFGPPWVKSNTWRGFNSHWNFCRSFAPWLPPLFGLIKTITGVTLAVGIGLITNVRGSRSLGFFLPCCFFLGDFLSDDLKLPFRGNFTIHDGGTIILECIPGKL